MTIPPKFKERNTERARELRNNATLAEKILWKHISRKQVGGFRFTRQLPIGPFFADFACRAKKLVLEIDGLAHSETELADARRTQYLAHHGYRVIRFGNEDVLGNVGAVVLSILETLENIPTPNPSRRREGGFDGARSRKREGGFDGAPDDIPIDRQVRT